MTGQTALMEEFERHGLEWPFAKREHGGGPELLAVRVDLLERMTAEFVARLAQWGANDRGPLDDDDAEAEQ